MSDMRDRVVIVTGAGNGLGRAYALDLAACGAAVVVNNRWTDRSKPSSAEAVVAEIEKAGGRAVANFDPVERPESNQAMVDQALATFGRLDAIVSNAGVPESQRFHRHSLEDFQTIFNINFFGALYLIHAALPALSKSESGRIVLSTSSAGLHGGDGLTAYSSSKAALIGLTHALAIESAARNLMVNAVAPYALTNMTAQHVAPGASKHMDPADVAPLVSWLVSPACDVSGQVIVCGGGKIRAAYSAEGPPVRLEKDRVGQAVHTAMAAEPREIYGNALKAFAAFMDKRPALAPDAKLV